MIRKALWTAFFTLIVSGSLLLIYLTIEKISTQKIIATKISSLPTTNLLNLDSAIFKMPTDTKVVLVFFNSDCEHCQYEANNIRKNIKSFEKVKVIFISSEPINSIRSFSLKYDLDHYPFIHFTKINREHVFDTFGSLSIPHIFIYNKDGQFIKEFKGETKVEAILKYIQ